MKRTIATIVLAGTVMFAGATSAMASTYPAPGDEQGTVSDGTIDRGETITFSGSGYVPGETVNITFEKRGGPRGSAPANFSVIADGNGAISANITFEDAGSYTIAAVGTKSGNVRSARVAVNNGNHGRGNNGNGKGGSDFVAVSSVTDAGTVVGAAGAGADSGMVIWGLVGGGVLAAGTASVVVARRRAGTGATD
ncbi:immunoglobulin domain-containing protein [Paenarthrobacter histidinolovorans]|uniref:immunoglobulin domain-containing protein n=1 Tax=Paenarthrobacter histidinolovorans TaxID=43664 RepID=UPI001667A3D9|nr:immunoglobulin domain-containing protein [Paenarthrobacter histidinolovorans]